MVDKKDYAHWALPKVAEEHDALNRGYFERGEFDRYPYFHKLKEALVSIRGMEGGRFLSCLDVGCGAAWQAVYLASQGLGPESIGYEGLDLSRHMCDRAKGNFPAGEFHVADIMEFASERRWDIVMACGAIEHFEDWRPFIGRLAPLSSKWLVVHKVFFSKGDAPTTKTMCDTYAGFVQPRMVINYGEFLDELRACGFEPAERIDWDVYPISCVVARKLPPAKDGR
jgi:SAM-dependent methyltransferase